MRVHLLVIGQSNVASHGRTRGASDFGQVFHDGTFQSLSDPIAGGTGDGGSVWTRLGPMLAADGAVSEFVLTVSAQGGTSIADWAPDGKCFGILAKRLPEITTCARPITHVVFHQGERDTMMGTSCASYVHHFNQMKNCLDVSLHNCPWIVCQASYRMGLMSKEVKSAQNEIIKTSRNVIAGPDTDLLGAAYRYDNTHFNDAGLTAFAAGLRDTFRCICREAAGSSKSDA